MQSSPVIPVSKFYALLTFATFTYYGGSDNTGYQLINLRLQILDGYINALYILLLLIENAKKIIRHRYV